MNESAREIELRTTTDGMLILVAGTRTLTVTPREAWELAKLVILRMMPG